MIKIEHSVVVDRPVEEVFAYATDVSKHAEWQTSALEARVDGPMQAGATGAIVRSSRRRMESTVRFDEYEPPRKFAIESTSWSGEVPRPPNLRVRGRRGAYQHRHGRRAGRLLQARRAARPAGHQA